MPQHDTPATLTLTPARKRTFYLPDDLYLRVKALVGSTRLSEGASLSGFVRDAIAEKLQREKKGKR